MYPCRDLAPASFANLSFDMNRILPHTCWSIRRCARRLGLLGALVVSMATGFAQSLSITTAAGTPGVAGSSNTAPGTFAVPHGVAVDTAGNAYIADTNNHAIRKISASGVISNFAGTPGFAGYINDATPNAPFARFNTPRGIAINPAGTIIFVADSTNHSIRQINLSGIGGSVTSVTTLAGTGLAGSTNAGASSTFSSPIGVTVNPAGDTVYVADTGNQLIRSITLAGPVVSTVAGLPGIAGFANGSSATATFSAPYGIAINTAGTALFVSDYANQAIRRINLSPVDVTTYAGVPGLSGSANSATGTTATFYFPAGLAFDQSDNLFVTEFGNNTIRMVSPTGTNAVATVAGSSVGSADGTGTSALFNGPLGIAARTVAGTLVIFIADTNNQLIRRTGTPIPSGTIPTITTNPISATAQIGGNLTLTAAATGTPTPTLRWQRQAGGTIGFVDLTDDANYSGTTTGTLTITNVAPGMTDDQLRLVATNTAGSVTTTAATLTVNIGTSITRFAGNPGFAGSLDGIGTAARFNTPTSIAMDAFGNFLVADAANHTIRRISPGGVVTTIAGQPGLGGYVDAAGSAARFNGPSAVAVDSAGNVYVADTYNHVIRLVSPSGVVTTVAGLANVSGSTNGIGNLARFAFPSGIAVDSSGTIYVADTGNSIIRRVSFGGNVSTLAGTPGVIGSANGFGPAASFSFPSGIALGAGGVLYVADVSNHMIRRVSATGDVTTLAGAGLAGSTDANQLLARFNQPSGVAVDVAGNVFVADTFNSTIRRIALNGDVTTVAGVAGLAGSTDGVGNAARLNQPFGLVVDSNNNIFIADTRNDAIRRTGTTSAPTIVTQPQNRTVAQGGSTTFTVVASGVPTPSYQWQRQNVNTFGFVNIGNTATQTGANTASLTISNFLIANAGDQYRVIVSNGVNPAATSDVATVTIGDLPVITSASSATFRATEASSFTVTATGTPTPVYLISGQPSWLSIDTTTGVLSGTPPADAVGTIPLTVFADNGGSASQAFTLTITPANVAPSVTTQPAAIAVNPGQSATFSVAVAGTGPFSYQWRRNASPITGASGSSYSVANAQLGNAGSYSVTITNSAGSIVSYSADLIVNSIPGFTSQPRTQTALAGSVVTMSVGATGGTSFTYQWRKNGVAIAGATNSTLTLTGVTGADSGVYDVVVTNALGNSTSSIAQLNVVTVPTAPTITASPATRTALAGTPTTFSVAASGAPAPGYQWRKNGSNIAGANAASLTLSSVQAGDAANYDVVVTNSVGSVTSASAGLQVIARSFAGIYTGAFSGGLGNFAMLVREDNTGVFLGYLPSNTAPVMSLNLAVSDSGAFTFLQPAVTTVLTPVSVTGTIAADGGVSGSLAGGVNANLTGSLSTQGATQNVAGFYQAGAGTNATSVYTIVGANNQAFTVIRSGTASDGGTGTVTNGGAVSVVTSRSVITQSINAATGVLTGTSTGAIVASYAGASESALAQQRLVNISTRARVGSGEAVAIAGFVISGTESKPVLIRAVGPTLGTAFQLAGALASPRLDLYQGTTIIATNTGIAGNRIAIDAVAQGAGAFALGAAGTDAAILTTLAPGTYTAIVSSTTANAGVALVEVYDLSAPGVGQKLLNISTRASAGTAENTLIAGFVVPAGTTKRVLIRGVGPGLSPFGVTGVLAQPTLSLLSGGTTVAQNAIWGSSADAAAISAASTQVGAFGLATNDAALVLTLAPGNYTAQVVGSGGATGVALIEVYELP